jgi:hypothetical protein
VSASHFILLIESDPTVSERLARQLIRQGVEPIRVADPAEAIDVVSSQDYAICAVLIPADLPPEILASAMKSLRRKQPALPAMAYGKAPDDRQRMALRGADVTLALWDGYDEGMLRFQINRMLSDESQHTPRASHRAPLHVPVRILVGGREKHGMLYSVSEGGCFIETPRASMDGARLQLFFELGRHPYELEGVVVFANVPGNLQRPNLPLGMGIRFGELPTRLKAPIRDFIEARMSSLEV